MATISVKTFQIRRSYTSGYRPPTTGATALKAGETLRNYADKVDLLGVGDGTWLESPIGTAIAKATDLANKFDKSGGAIDGNTRINSGTFQVGTSTNPTAAGQTYLGSNDPNPSGGSTPMESTTWTQRVGSNILPWGTYEQACGLWCVVNYGFGPRPAVNGFVNPSDIATYYDRDSVNLYLGASPGVMRTLTNPTYTTTAVIPGGTISAADQASYRVGMFIDTAPVSGNKYSGVITSVTSTQINVSGWFQGNRTNAAAGNTTAGQVPPNGTTAYINPITKAFVTNWILDMNPSFAGGRRGVLGEWSIYNRDADYGKAALLGHLGDQGLPYAGGIDFGDAGGQYPATYHMLSRGKTRYGYVSLGAVNAEFYAGFTSIGGSGQPAYGFQAANLTGKPFAVTDAADNERWTVDSLGNTTIGGTAYSTPAILNLRPGTAPNYATRIFADNASSTDGTGTMHFIAGSHTFDTGSFTVKSGVFNFGNPAVAATAVIYGNSSGTGRLYDTGIQFKGGNSGGDGRGVITHLCVTSEFYNNQTGAITVLTSGNTNLTNSSDARLKENIADAGPALPQLDDRIRTFRWKGDGSAGYGPIAQEVREKHPERVREDEKGTLMLDAPSPYLLEKGIQELLAMVISLKDRVNLLEKENEYLKTNKE